MKLSTYLTYDGNAREAFTFQQVLGGTLELMTFAQAPDAEQFPPSTASESCMPASTSATAR